MVEGTIIESELEKPEEEIDNSNLSDISYKKTNELPVDEIPIEVNDSLPKQGDMSNYTKEIDYGVIDEDGTRISCKSMAEVRILSLLLEMKGGK